MRVIPYLLPVIITTVFVLTAATQYIWLAIFAFTIVGILRKSIGKFEKSEIIEEYNFFHFDKKMNLLKSISGLCFVSFNIWVLYFLFKYELQLWQYIIFIISYILINSAFATSLAHDLMHSSIKIDRIISVILLIQNGFFYLISDHLYTHHQYAASSLDPATANKGESIYHYFYRSINERIKITFFSGSTFPSDQKKSIIRHNIFYLICCLGYLGIAILLGKLVFFCVLLGYISVTLIYESVTYIQHYGLSRLKTKNGDFTAMELQHAWNCFYKTSSYMHFMMPIHSIHHLRTLPDNFEGFYGLNMPKAFGKMLVIAWFPNIWFKLMNEMQNKS